MYWKKYYLQEIPIPQGCVIYDDSLEVAGVGYRKMAVYDFVLERGRRLEFEREPANRHDPNAIKVIGRSTKWFVLTHRRHLGYVPKDIARDIVRGGFWGQVLPRLKKIYVGDDGYVEVEFQLLGPKGRKREYEAT